MPTGSTYGQSSNSELQINMDASNRRYEPVSETLFKNYDAYLPNGKGNESNDIENLHGDIVIWT